MQLDILRDHLLSKMNANSKGITFNAGYLIKSADTSFEFKTFPNHFTETTTVYTPAMFTMIGEPQNVPNKDMVNWSIILELILTGEKETDTQLVNEVEALDEFRLGLINNPIDTVGNYKLIMSANPIARGGEIKVRGGKKRLTVSMEISIDSGIGIFAGNDVIYKLALLNDTPMVIFPINSTTINGKTEETETDLTASSGVTTTIARDGTIRHDMSIVFDNSDLHNEIAKGLSGVSTGVNIKFDYQEIWSQFSVRKNTIISGGTISKNANSVIILNIQLVETD